MSRETPNIILITIDCLRSDHLSCYGYSRETSPTLDGLASKGALFLRAISNGGDTPASFPSILASQLPPIKEEEYRLLPKRSLTLAGLFDRSEYQTAAYHSNPFLTRFFHYDRGFEVFKDSLGTFNWARKMKIRIMRAHGIERPYTSFLRVLTKIGYLRNHFLYSLGVPSCVTAEKLTNQAISWLDKCHSGFFIWLHYMDTHYPFLPPSKYARRFCNRHVSRYRMSTLYHKQIINRRSPERLSQAEIDTLINLYDACINYVDDNLAKLCERLESRLGNTVIVVTADHGEAFGEHGLLGHNSLYEEVINVPLIIVGGSIKAGTIVKEPVELMDLAPTVADLLGFTPPSNFRGKSLLPMISGGQRRVNGVISTVIIPAFRKRILAYRTSEWKYICTESIGQTDSIAGEELYDLRNDPREKHNLHGLMDEEARAVELKAIGRLQRFKELKMADKTAYEKRRIRAKLKKFHKP